MRNRCAVAVLGCAFLRRVRVRAKHTYTPRVWVASLAIVLGCDDAAGEGDGASADAPVEIGDTASDEGPPDGALDEDGEVPDAVADAATDAAVDLEEDGGEDAAVDGNGDADPDGVADVVEDGATDGATDGVDAGESTSAVIGPTGGTITSADGILTVDVPAGALAEATTITMTAVAEPLGWAYDMEPDGLDFAVPAAVTAHFGTDDIDGLFWSVSEEDGALLEVPGVLLFIESGSGEIEVPDGVVLGVAYDPLELSVAAPLEHFSQVTVLEAPFDVRVSVEPGQVASGQRRSVTIELGSAPAVRELILARLDLSREAVFRAGLSVPVTPYYQPVEPVLELTPETPLAETYTGTQQFECIELGTGPLGFAIALSVAGDDTIQLLHASIRTDDLPCAEGATVTYHPVPAGGEAITVNVNPLAPDFNMLALSHTGGVSFYDPETFEVVHPSFPLAGPVYEARVFSGDTDAGVVYGLMTVGPSGLTFTGHNGTDWGATLIDPTPNLLTRLLTIGTSDFLAVNATGNGVEYYAFNPAGYWSFDPARGVEASALPADVGNAVAVAQWPFGAAGDLLVLTRGLGETPGRVYLANLNTPDVAATLIGSVGGDARHVACSPQICAASSYGAGTITAVFAGDGGAPALGDPIPVSGKPIGIWIHGLDVYSTGFDTDTLDVTSLDADGEFVCGESAPVDCDAPGHAIAYIEGALEELLTTCYEDEVIEQRRPLLECR